MTITSKFKFKKKSPIFALKLHQPFERRYHTLNDFIKMSLLIVFIMVTPAALLSVASCGTVTVGACYSACNAGLLFAFRIKITCNEEMTHLAH